MFPQSDSKKVLGHPLRVGLYARVSTYDQKTLPLQIRAMRESAGRRNWTIAQQVKEMGSGASQRELRETLIAHARRREIDVVLVWRLDRGGDLWRTCWRRFKNCNTLALGSYLSPKHSTSPPPWAAPWPDALGWLMPATKASASAARRFPFRKRPKRASYSARASVNPKSPAAWTSAGPPFGVS